MVLELDFHDQLTAFVDISFGNSSEKDRKHHSMIVVKYRNAVEVATPHVQRCVSLGSTGADYVALSKIVRTVVWPRNVPTELGKEQI